MTWWGPGWTSGANTTPVEIYLMLLLTVLVPLSSTQRVLVLVLVNVDDHVALILPFYHYAI
jgi:hypothetical protein